MNLHEAVDFVRQSSKLILADDFEIACESTWGSRATFENGVPEFHTQESEEWISLRILHRKRVGRSIGTSFTREGLKRLVEDAFTSAQVSSVDPWFRFPVWKFSKTSPLERASPKRFETSAFGRFPHPKSLYFEIEGFVPKIRESYAQWRIQSQVVRKTERLERVSERELCSRRWAATDMREGEVFTLETERSEGTNFFWNDQAVMDLKELGEQAVALAQGSVFVIDASVPVVLVPSAAAELVRLLIPHFQADAIQAGNSFLPPVSDEPREFHLSPCLSLADDALFPGAVHLGPFDLEGTPSQRTMLLDQGRFVGCLHDTYTATKENRLSTGNFRRGPHDRTPRIGPTLALFLPGEGDPIAWLGETQVGIRIDTLLSCRPLRGTHTEFEFEGAGWRIEGGEGIEPLRSIRFRVDLLEWLRQAISVGNDLTFFGDRGAPSILFQNIPIRS